MSGTRPSWTATSLRSPVTSWATRMRRVRPPSTTSWTPPARRVPASGTGIAALDEGVPLTLIGEAVFARCLSAMKEERVAASKVFTKEIPAFTGDKAALSRTSARLFTPARSSPTLRATPSCVPLPRPTTGTSTTAASPSCRRGGCIIRSVFLGKIKEAYDKDPNLVNLLTIRISIRRDHQGPRSRLARSGGLCCQGWYPHARLLLRPQLL